MILSASHGVVRIELSPEERVILHLAGDIPLPETPWDRRAAPRTVEGIARATGIPASTTYKILRELRRSGVVHHHHVSLASTVREGNYHYVHVLTADGRQLAEAIKARCML